MNQQSFSGTGESQRWLSSPRIVALQVGWERRPRNSLSHGGGSHFKVGQGRVPSELGHRPEGSQEGLLAERMSVNSLVGTGWGLGGASTWRR